MKVLWCVSNVSFFSLFFSFSPLRYRCNVLSTELISQLRAGSLSYSFLNPQFTYMIFICSQWSQNSWRKFSLKNPKCIKFILFLFFQRKPRKDFFFRKMYYIWNIDIMWNVTHFKQQKVSIFFFKSLEAPATDTHELPWIPKLSLAAYSLA